MADTLVDDFDMIDFLHTLTERCVQLLGVSAAGMLLTDGKGALQVVAASSERTRLLELFQLQTDQGPCLDCFRTSQPVSVADLSSAGRWPRFTAAAPEIGFRVRPRSADAAAQRHHRRTEPFRHRTRRRRTREASGSARPSRTSPRSACFSTAPSRQRDVVTEQLADRAQQPRSDRAGQGYGRRTPQDRR